MRRKRILAVMGVLSLLGLACGSRLSPTQVEALNAPAGAGGASAGGATPGGGSGPVTTAPSITPVPGPPVSRTGGAGTIATTTVPSLGATGPTGAAGTQGQPASGAATSTSGGPTTGVTINSAVCSGPASGPGVSASELDIGNVSTLTGPVPGLFLGAQHGTNAFTAYINSIGGICGRRLVVKSADDNLDTSQNATATESIAGSILAFVGSFSGDDEGGAAVLHSDGIPDIGEALSTQRFGLANNFSPEPKPLGWNVAPYLYFKQRFPDAITHMAVLTENQPTAVALQQAQTQALESIGYKFVYEDDGLEPTQTDYSADAEAMKSKGVQGLVFQAPAEFYADLARSMQDVGLDIPLADYGSTAYDPTFVADAGNAANGAIIEQEEAMYAGEDADSVPMVGLFDKWYEALYGEPPDLYAVYAWMSGLLFIDGLNKGGGLTRANLLRGLGQVTDFNASGLVADDNPAGKKPAYCYLIVDIVNGKFVRDRGDPATSFNCADSPNYYFVRT